MNKNIFLLLTSLWLVITLPLSGEGGGKPKMKLTSPDFQNNGYIPKKFTCDGDNINPALAITDIPPGAKSLVLIVDDPDASRGTWVHWVVYDIGLLNRIEQNTIPGKQGVSSAGDKNYHGPCPPYGIHRYFFKIYALDKELDLPEGQDKEQVERAMRKHIIDKAELVGLYTRK
jgi:Raf kinase inhibitor-like YbhB/YbcL family protein